MHVRDLFNLDGKVALVTGSARNLGYDMAEALAEAGADVAITSRTLANAEAAAERIRVGTGRRVLALQVDVREESAIERLVDAVLAEFGRIDILVNNAGNVVSTPQSAPLERRSNPPGTPPIRNCRPYRKRTSLGRMLDLRTNRRSICI